MDKSAINKRVIEVINVLLNTEKKLNKTILATSLDIKPAKFSEILNERMNAGVDLISLLCLKYNISSDYILTGRGEMRDDNSEMNNLSSEKFLEIIENKDQIIRKQAEEIGRLKEKVESIESNSGKGASNVDLENVHVG